MSNFKEKTKYFFKKLKRLTFCPEDAEKKEILLRNIISGVIFFCTLLLLDLGFRFIYRQANTSPVGSEVPFFFSLAWCALLCAISFLLPRLARRIYQITVCVIYCIFAIVHAFMFSFFGNFFTMSSVIFAGDGAEFFDWSYFDIPKKFILLIIICIIGGVLSALILPKTKYTLVRVISASVAFGGAITCIALMSSGYFPVVESNAVLTWESSSTEQNLEPGDIYKDFTDTNKCFYMAGLYQYTFRDLSIFSGLDDWLFADISIGELNNYYESKEKIENNEMTGAFKGKDLILIQLESIDTWMVNDISMPFLSSLRARGINFTDYYAPKFLAAAATFNTEVIANTGIVPHMNANFGHFADNYYPYSAANLFKNAGYSVESYHRSNPTIYNRGEVHTGWGYEAYNTGYAMGMKNYDLDTELMAGYDMFVKDEPFMSFIITYTGHGPYDGTSIPAKEYDSIIRSALPDDAEDEYIWALCHAYNTDQFIKQLYEKLEDDGRLENTVLIFYTDHYDHYVTDKNILTKYKGTTDANLMTKVPLIIYNEGMKPISVDKPMATYDLLPTIVNLFSLDCDARYLFGHDAFSDGGGYVIFADQSWYDGETYFNINADAPTELSRKRAKEINERLENSWNTVKSDYFAKKDN